MASHGVFRSFALFCGLAALAGCAAPSPSAEAAQPDLPVSEQALLGATAQMLDADFGAPMLRRADGPAQVWVYESAVCGLQIFLYPDASGTPRVAAAVPDNGNPASCMRSFAHNLTDAALEHPPSS